MSQEHSEPLSLVSVPNYSDEQLDASRPTLLNPVASPSPEAAYYATIYRLFLSRPKEDQPLTYASWFERERAEGRLPKPPLPPF